MCEEERHIPAAALQPDTDGHTALAAWVKRRLDSALALGLGAQPGGWRYEDKQKEKAGAGFCSLGRPGRHVVGVLCVCLAVAPCMLPLLGWPMCVVLCFQCCADEAVAGEVEVQAATTHTLVIDGVLIDPTTNMVRTGREALAAEQTANQRGCCHGIGCSANTSVACMSQRAAVACTFCMRHPSHALPLRGAGGGRQRRGGGGDAHGSARAAG